MRVFRAGVRTFTALMSADRIYGLVPGSLSSSFVLKKYLGLIALIHKNSSLPLLRCDYAVLAVL